MLLTVAGVRARLGPRLGPYVALADAAAAIAYSLNDLDLYPADPLAPADTDLAILTDVDHNQFADMAELHAWETVQANLTQRLLAEAGIDEPVAEVARRIDRIIVDRRKVLLDRYGVGLSTPTAGVIRLDFVQQDDPNL